uniref:Uncharacterized protein n=1 Tax=Ficedula albicollis TaxID=59894 RepID=A0A803VP87_FICAL
MSLCGDSGDTPVGDSGDTPWASLCGDSSDTVPVSPEPISVVPNRHLERQRCPLILGIRGGSRPGAVPVPVPPRCHRALSPQDVALLELFSGDKDAATPFTFYKTFGGSTHTFEAAAFPGLFLSTATGPGRALALASDHGATAFYLHRQRP